MFCRAVVHTKILPSIDTSHLYEGTIVEKVAIHRI